MISPKLYQLEHDIADFLLTKLENEQITIERAAEIAEYVRHSLPDNLTDEQIDSILPILDEKFIELTSVVHKHILTKQELGKQTKISEAERLIHEGKLQDAIKLMNSYIHQKL